MPSARPPDAAGNQWAYSYDLLGRQISASDPDAGQTTSSYNGLSQLSSSTDGNGNTVSYTYDAAGRPTAEYNTTGGVGQTSSDELAAWTYDTAGITGGGTAVTTTAAACPELITCLPLVQSTHRSRGCGCSGLGGGPRIGGTGSSTLMLPGSSTVFPGT